MARRADPERLYQAHRAGLTSRLRQGQVSAEAAEKWVAAWEAEAADRRLDRLKPGFWDPAWSWIEEQRAKR